MKNLLGVLAILSATSALLPAQTGPTGTWRVDGVERWFPWEAVLTADGSNGLIGAVSSCASIRPPVEISGGRIDGNTITFKCTAGDNQPVIKFTGAIGDEGIAFAWEKLLPESGDTRTYGMFADSAPRKFIAKRAEKAADPVTTAAAQVRRYSSVTFERILRAEREPENWLTYSGTFSGLRHSLLTQITPGNVKNLGLAWIWQAQSQDRFLATPLVVDGVLYAVQPPNDVVALDAASGRVIWSFSYKPMPGAIASGGGGRPNRGLAIHGHTLFLGTLDAHLLAINAYSGELIWKATVANAVDPGCGMSPCYVITHAPLVVKDRVIVGVGGGEGPTRCFIAAYDVKTGKEAWRFYTVPGSGEPGNETWPREAWKTGGAGVWNTGSYDPDLNLTYWGTGNPYPWRTPETRQGDNLYSASLVALDADTGKLKWHYQFTPHDTRDWDSAHVPVLTDFDWQGRQRRALLLANKNGLLYALDRATGQFLYGKPFVEVTWMDGFDQKGRPIEVKGRTDSAKAPTLPGIATNWYPPSYSPATGLFYVASWERGTVDGRPQRPSPAYGAMRAFDPKTGARKWEFKKNDAVFTSGALTTASGLLFTGTWGDYYSGEDAAGLADGYFYALDARTGQLLWQMSLAGSVHGGPMSYSVRGKQYIAVAAGNTLFAFALRQ